MNSFIIARLQRKLKNLLKIYFPGPIFSVLGLVFLVSPMRWVSALGSWVPSLWSQDPGSQVSGPTKCPGSRVPLFGYALEIYIRFFRLYMRLRSDLNLDPKVLKMHVKTFI